VAFRKDGVGVGSPWRYALSLEPTPKVGKTNMSLAAQTLPTLEGQNVCLIEAPSAQSTVDLIPEWTSKLPGYLGTNSGFANLFEDGRASWAIQALGGVKAKSVVELGPLEGGHTYMLEKAGASEVIAIEANKVCFMKCLIAKELTGLTKSRFLLGDFTQWLDVEKRKFDIGWVAGVLYHMDDPLRLLRQMADHTDKIYLWTHYVPDESFGDEGIWTRTIVRIDERTSSTGRVVPHYVKTYVDMGDKAVYCGGLYKTASWIRKSDILEELKLLGFAFVRTTLDVRDHPNGPCISIAASKSELS
jgi:SAM-dependent methyltransferase